MKQPARKVLIRIFIILIVVALISAIIATYAVQTQASDTSIVRVKLSVGTPSQFSFSVCGNYQVKQNQNVKLSTASYTVKVSGSTLNLYCGNTLLYSGADFTMEECKPAEGQYNYASIKTTTYGTNKYLGSFRFILDGSHIDVINQIYIESYLYGVVPYEMSNSWPIEALKAQAVAARTYVMRYMSDRGSYDVVDTAANQVYKGYNAANTNAIQAVDETSRMVLKCQGALAQTFYTASNGGYVDIPQHLWSASATVLPYHLIQEDPYDTQNTWSLQEVLIFPKTISDSSRIAYQYSDRGSMVSGTGNEAANAERYFKISALSAVVAKGYIASVTGDIEITGISSIVPHTFEGQHGSVNDYSGTNSCVCFTKADVTMTVLAYRTATIQEQQQTGEAVVREPVTVAFTVNMHEFDKQGGTYQAFNNASLRLFVVAETDTGWNIYHRRYGHGVGMSQRGAQTRAKSGQTFEQILSFYYPNTYLETVNISPPTLADAAAATDSTNAVICNCVSYVNIRSTPDTSNPAIGKALLGSRITVTEANAATGWHKINYGGIDAYISADYVKLDTVEESTPTTTETTTVTEISATMSPEVTCTGTVSVNVLNIRSGPGTTNEKIGRFAKGDSVEIIQANITTDWHQILYNGNICYVYASYVSIPGTETQVQTTTGVVTSSVLNVRGGPGTSYNQLGKLKKGDTVDIITASAVQGWHKISYGGTEAYVYAAYVSVSDGNTVQATGVVTASILNVRSGPGTSYSKLDMLGKGDKVDIVTVKVTESWHKILYKGSAAYVHADYISVDGSQSGFNETDTQTSAVYASVNASLLNFRKAASLSAPVLNTLARGDIVQVLEQGSTWYKVKYGGQEGYMYASYLKISSAVYGTVSAGTLNVRSGASTSSAVLGKLLKGYVVEIVSTGSTWHTIKYQTTAAYVYAPYIKIQ